ncbi:MAG: KEOPS complex kinase/ATPase Bud32 [Candidatus Micrarchaeota archaeon]|nr:KEOPS complex kinase/ATPase Bud32 [Candidatus Micrarchaeota archaeon]
MLFAIRKENPLSGKRGGFGNKKNRLAYGGLSQNPLSGKRGGFGRGAEAVLFRTSFLGMPAVEKFRVEKKYRARALDREIRQGRTRREARLLSAAKKAGVLCPVVYEVAGFSILMKFLRGKMLHEELQRRKITGEEISAAASILARLHSVGVIHGDFTPANLMLTKDGMAVIDFGLGFFSCDDEDRGVDVLTMKKALGKEGGRFVAEYLKFGGKKKVAEMVSKIEARARYMERG